MGTMVQKRRPKAATAMSTKAQEVALDKALVARFKAGDESAFEEMVSRYWDRIYAMVHKLLGNTQDAEEFTQDAFIRAHRGRGSSGEILASPRGCTRSPRILPEIATGTGGAASATNRSRSTSRSPPKARLRWRRSSQLTSSRRRTLRLPTNSRSESLLPWTCLTTSIGRLWFCEMSKA